MRSTKKGALSFEEYRDALLSMYREMPHEDASADAGHIFDGDVSARTRDKESQETNVNARTKGDLIMIWNDLRPNRWP
jgi:hypothetical protein